MSDRLKNKCLKLIESDYFDSEWIIQELGVDELRGKSILSALVDDRLIEESKIAGYWSLTVKGSLALRATKRRLFKKSSAKKRLNEFLERVKTVNDEDRFLHNIDLVGLIDYDDEENELSGLNILYALSNKKLSETESERRTNRLISQSKLPIDNDTQYLDLPRRELKAFLKSGKQILKIYHVSADRFPQEKVKVIFKA
ncbi:hypothetical protein [uncultured Roseivirga sp.]|uniref:hypothetical protein n=1 Tax=uncultured Roseivirga sp. TaxID=543088 RepID=UPI000D79CE33|nr:hypothetical protein [uncultured Roseivirga sp.]PWL30679.1 MAG: hypothetical protein DCO95_04160 [Roseivirga sp. XM-24bin3]